MDEQTRRIVKDLFNIYGGCIIKESTCEKIFTAIAERIEVCPECDGGKNTACELCSGCGWIVKDQ